MATNVSERVWSDLAVPPGELLQEELDAIGMTQQELAERTGRPTQVINEIIRDKKRITHDTALELEKVLGIPAHFWVNLEADYQLTRARLRNEQELRRQEEWLKEFPIREMENRQWIPKHSEKIEKVRALLRFLGVASFSAWRQTVLGFRITPGASVSEGALAAWLRKGELEGRQIETAPYNESRFRQALLAARDLTTEGPEVFVTQVRKSCAAAGVAVVYIPELPRSAANGAARWLTPTKALIQLSLRYKSNDQLWFSFFHEACHVLRHRIREVHIDGLGGDDQAEEEANRFASDTLIPPDAWREFIGAGIPSRDDIVRFAGQIGIAPGIVVGRLQHERLIDWSSFNDLKVRFTWTEDET
jgi:HTH-type transcriptional regulator/antitoxin HigA